MTIGDYDVDKALQIVKGARGYIHPNPGFLSQLRKYHSNDVKKVRASKCLLVVLLFTLELVSVDTALPCLFIRRAR